jgi:hypothetical protein
VFSHFGQPALSQHPYMPEWFILGWMKHAHLE